MLTIPRSLSEAEIAWLHERIDDDHAQSFPGSISGKRAINPIDDSPKSTNDVVLMSLCHRESWGEYIQLTGALTVSGSSCDGYIKVAHNSKELQIMGPGESSHGTTSHVYPVEIFVSENSMVTSSGVYIVKILRSGEHAHQRYENERRVLLSILPKHVHIVSLLTSFIYSSRFHLVFHKADMDLETFLTTPISQQHAHHLLRKRSLWLQMAGLASAMEFLHHKNISHGDIKPSNILIFQDPDFTLRLADFGAACDNDDDDECKVRGGDSTSGIYSPPEMWHRSGLRLRKPIDIWALGCVFSELATYIEYAEHGVAEFRSRRYQTIRNVTSAVFHDGEQLKVSVLDWLSYLRSRSQTADVVGQLIMSFLVTSPAERRNASGLGDVFLAACKHSSEPRLRLGKLLECEMHWLSNGH
ncbi:kinase-like domain-containing protein [Trichophaea hybrida]|nr:kinase-like domain-containing protein [Trichophaea hybrida]